MQTPTRNRKTFYILHLIDEKIVGYTRLQLFPNVFAQIVMSMNESEVLQFFIDRYDIGISIFLCYLVSQLPKDTPLPYPALTCQHLDYVLPDKRANHIDIIRTFYQLFHKS